MPRPPNYTTKTQEKQVYERGSYIFTAEAGSKNLPKKRKVRYIPRTMKVTLLMAQTLDGRIAKDSDHFPDWTEKADKKFFMDYTKEAGVMIMGRKTFETLPGVLPGRLTVILSRDPITTIKGQKHSMYSKIFTGVEKEWVPHWIIDGKQSTILTSCSPKAILERLEKEGHDHVVLTGGTTINSLFAKEGLIDEIIVTVSPVIFGEGLGLFDAETSLDLTLEKSEPLGDNSRTLYYKVNK